MIKSLLGKFNIFKNESEEIKRIAFIDGDQGVTKMIDIYDEYLKPDNVETHFIRLAGKNARPPKALKDTDFNKIYLTGYENGKEVVDKFIAGYIQKSVDEGYKEITVVSGDYDFIDIFKMAMMLNENATNVKFRMIISSNNKKFKNAKTMDIELIKAYKN